MSKVPKILLLQARLESDPMREHEVNCFYDRTELPRGAIEIFNMTQGVFAHEKLTDYDAIMVGGSGDFSVVESGFDWHQDMLDLLSVIARKKLPMFASCFGFQALAQALGGTLERVPELGEVGTYDVSLTDAGKEDQAFSWFPDTFKAQLGHLDRVSVLPDELVCLAASERCPVQAIRLKDSPIIATQFHPELSVGANFERFVYYIEHYKTPGMSHEEAIESAKPDYAPSPECSELLKRYLRDELGFHYPTAS